MLYLNFARIFKLRGIRFPHAQLKKMGYSGAYATKLGNNRIVEMNMQRLEKFCIDFNCTPNDIVQFLPNKSAPIPKDHALNQLIREDLTQEIDALINALPVEKIHQLRDIIKNMD
jgi:DNA-binding Xre family transcriptional regulator